MPDYNIVPKNDALFICNRFIRCIPSPNELLYIIMAIGCIFELGEQIVCFEQLNNFLTSKIE